MKFRPLTKLTKLSVLGEAVLLAHWGSRILTVGNCLLFLLRLAQIRLGKRLGKLGQVSRGLTRHCFARRLYFFSPSGNLHNIALRQVNFFKPCTTCLRAASQGDVSQPAFFLDSLSCSNWGQWGNAHKGGLLYCPLNKGI